MPDSRLSSRDRPILAEALRLLGVRPLTVAEMRSRLSRRGYADDEIDEALERLSSEGLLDDPGLCRHYIAVRAERRGHGRTRLVRELEARGVARGVAAAAWEVVVSQGEIDPAALLRREVARRVGRQEGRLEESGYRRVYNALLRAGFDASEIVSELRPYRASGGSGHAADTHGNDHDEFA